MTQLQYDLIRKCILTGMPAMAQELLSSFDAVVSVYNEHNKAAQNVKEEKEGE